MTSGQGELFFVPRVYSNCLPGLSPPKAMIIFFSFSEGGWLLKRGHLFPAWLRPFVFSPPEEHSFFLFCATVKFLLLGQSLFPRKKPDPFSVPPVQSVLPAKAFANSRIFFFQQKAVVSPGRGLL